MSGARLALIVANDQFDDPELGRLAAPAHDAAALAELLGDPLVGGFDVDVLRNQPVQAVRIAVETFFQRRSIDDLLLLYFSCHGIKNSDGELFLAMRDTEAGLLAATGLAAAFVNRQSADSRAGRTAMFLDCCFGGAFEKGMVVKAAGDAVVKDTFAGQETSDEARGRVVVTASTATQYAFEGGKLAKHDEKTSVFTSAVIDGLSTGEADRDGDGLIGMNELFSYVEREVHRKRPEQRPQKFVYGAIGEIVLARSGVRRKPLEPWVVEMMSHPTAGARRDAVAALRERVRGTDLGMALSAWDALEALRRDDNREVAKAAKDAVAEATLQVTPPSLRLQVAEGGHATAEVVVTGPPISLAASARVASPWLSVNYDRPTVQVTASDPGVEEAVDWIVLENAVGVCRVEVRARRGPSSSPVTTPSWLERLRARLSRVPSLRRWLVVPVVMVAAVAVLTTWRPWSEGAGEEVTLPEGPRLEDDVLVWSDGLGLVSEGESMGWRRLVNSADRQELWPIVMPGRRTVLYQAKPATAKDSDADDMSLRVVASDGTGDQALFEGNEDCPNTGRPALSPDASRLAVVCFDEDGVRMGGVRILSLDGELIAVLDEDAGAGSPSWTEDGKYIVYWVQNDFDFGNRKGSSLWSIAVDQTPTRAPVQLTDDLSKDSLPAVSPDGTRIVFVRATERGTGDLWLLDVQEADGALRPATLAWMATSSGSAIDNDPTWTPDGAAIVFAVDGRIMKVAPDVTATAVPYFESGDDRQARMLAGARR